MNGNPIEPTYRTISVIALLQIGVVVGGTLFVTVMCKLKGYGGGVVPDWFFNSGALFIRRSGWTLLLIPACWASGAIFARRFELQPWFHQVLIATGLASILFGIYNYITIGFNPCIL